jgi:glycosyltransferase involved in cell wall biosynthesis
VRVESPLFADGEFVPILTPPSVLVLTKDEEINIASCLETLSFSDDIVVLDSYSTDQTLEIAKTFANVRIVQRTFDTWSRHSNWALEHIPFKHPWVYYSDADEQVTAELRDEILRVTNDPGRKYVAYRLRYKNIFMGRWLRRGGIYPVWIIRLFRPDRVRYEDREVNAHPVVRGPVGELKEHFVHYSFNKGLVPWFHKHNSYSQMECHEAIRVMGKTRLADHVRGAFAKDKSTRRRAIKNIAFYAPLRALARFVYMFGWKQGCLDGSAGFHYANMIAMYEYWIALKVREQRSNWRERNNQIVERLLREESA